MMLSYIGDVFEFSPIAFSNAGIIDQSILVAHGRENQDFHFEMSVCSISIVLRS
jgi:hypothetical protein